MSRGEHHAKGRFLFASAAAFLALLLFTRGPTEAGDERPIGFDPARQRGEMVQLLRSIDTRLQQLVDLQAKPPSEDR